ncbi:MAG: putative toxin-antitoxin system toxin component, PIN family [Candidatus Brocadiaceae bacterium]|nr:putative toxin-antitoxin system toxin component, PIN family [Candidatus Brocadiaceae bacterium]
MRVVIDTNVFVSSFFGGTPRKIIDLWKSGDVTLCLSRDILDEYVKVLQRIGLQDESELEELLSLFARGFNTLFTTKTPEIRVVKDDPDDDKFIECAVALKAKVIVTGDKSIKALGEYMEIKILTPQEFLKDYDIR